MILGGRYQIGPVVAVQWHADLEQQFPDADHHGCRQEMRHTGSGWEPHYPVRCVGYHCPHCGAATGSFGHRDCPAVAQ